HNLALALGDQARASEGAERARLLGEAVEAMRACLTIFTPELAPEYHAVRLTWIEELEADLRSGSPDELK
ncbi:MAG TPA: hypothetical protein VML54_04600, partial [Candidatus Limnocylindrales bacterium]|nr:hypothetical protein [Candidatus Limnocylindrales bacterium]